jgi:hypothetical protein
MHAVPEKLGFPDERSLFPPEVSQNIKAFGSAYLSPQVRYRDAWDGIFSWNLDARVLHRVKADAIRNTRICNRSSTGRGTDFPERHSQPMEPGYDRDPLSTIQVSGTRANCRFNAGKSCSTTFQTASRSIPK